MKTHLQLGAFQNLGKVFFVLLGVFVGLNFLC
jgi:hypothetical protein